MVVKGKALRPVPGPGFRFSSGQNLTESAIFCYYILIERALRSDISIFRSGFTLNIIGRIQITHAYRFIQNLSIIMFQMSQMRFYSTPVGLKSTRNDAVTKIWMNLVLTS